MDDLDDKSNLHSVHVIPVTTSKVSPDESSNNKYPVSFDTALESTEFGKYNYFLIFISGLIIGNVLLENLGMSFVLPVSQCDLNLTIQQRGILSSISFAGIIISSHLWGFLADTKGRKKIMHPTLFVGFLFTVLSSFSTNFWMLTIFRFLNGIFISAGSATIFAYLGEFHTDKKRLRAIMGSSLISCIVSLMMPIMAWLVINQEWKFYIPYLDITYKPWRLFIVVCGMSGFLSGLGLFMLTESPKFEWSQREEEKTITILQDIFHMNTGKDHKNYPVSHVLEDSDAVTHSREPGTNVIIALFRTVWQQTQPLFNREYVHFTLLFCVIFFSIFITSNGLYMWFPHIINSVIEFINENPGKRSYICDVIHVKQEKIFQRHTPDVCIEKFEISTYENALVLEALYVAGFAVISILLNKLSKKFISFFLLCICGICGIVSAVVNILMVSMYMQIILFVCGIAVNVVLAATVNIYPTRLRSMAVCISLMMGRIGCVIGAEVFGSLLSDNCEVAIILPSSLLIMAGILTLFLPKSIKKPFDNLETK